MDFELSREQKMIQKNVKEFIRKRIAPIADELDRESRLPEGIMIKAKLSNMFARIEAARGLVYRAALMADKADCGGKGTEIHKLAAAAILFAGETAMRAANESLQIHGGYGYTPDYPINRFYRDAKLMEIGAGTSEIRRLVVADELIKKGTGFH